MSQTVSRKDDHIRIGLEEDTRCSVNYFDDVHLVHDALPETDKDSISLETRLFGRKLSAPIVVSAITGGSPLGKKLNTNLARAAADAGVGMGVGSQRPAVENGKLEKTFAPLVNSLKVDLKRAWGIKQSACIEIRAQVKKAGLA